MIKIKKIFIACMLTILISACGYTPIFSKKTVNFSIENIEFSGDQDVTEKISNSLSSYQNKPNKEKKISLILHNSKVRSVASKNSKGEAQVYRVNIHVKMKLILNENKFFEKNIEKSTIYTALERKSDEKMIEDKLVENLSHQIAKEIILDLLDKTK